MGIEFRNSNSEPTPGSRPNSTGPGDDAMDELRRLFGKGGAIEGGPGGDRNRRLTDKEISDQFGPETLGMVTRVQKRLTALVEAMHDFVEAQRTGGDVTTTLLKFTKLLTETTQRYNAMEISSMLATGIQAIVELENQGYPKPEDSDEDDL